MRGSDSTGSSAERTNRLERPSSEPAAEASTPGYPSLAPGQLEQQQTVLLETLRRAAGTPVSYAALRDAGVEFPASVASELELAGIEIEHCHVTAEPGEAGERVPALRLAPSRLQAAQGVPAERWPERPRSLLEQELARSGEALAASALASRRGWPRQAKSGRGRAQTPESFAPPRPPAIGASRWLIAGVLIAGVVAVIIIASLAGGGERGSRPSAALRPAPPPRSNHASREAVRARRDGSGQGARAGAAAQTGGAKAGPASRAAAGRAQRPLPRTPVSATLATNLEAEGHRLLEAGSSTRAIPVLDRALAATGEHSGACVEPNGVACLEYAYALFDLGRARLERGEASAAVAILERRLHVDNQRPIVQAELEAARAKLARSGGA